MVDNLNCDFCQRTKLDGKGYGFLQEHEVQSIPFEECTVDLTGPWNIQVCGKPHKFEAFDVPIQDLKSRTQVKNPSQDSKPKIKDIIVVCFLSTCWLVHSQIPGWRMTPRSVTSEMCALQQKIPKVRLAPKNILMKLYPLLCMPWKQQYILPWEGAWEVSHSTGTCSLILLWLLIGTKMSTYNRWKSHKRKSKALSIWLHTSTKGT